MAKKKSAPTSAGVRRQRQRLKFLLVSAIAFLLLLIGVGGWWLITEGRTTEMRSQASVDLQYGLQLTPSTSSNRVDVVISANSELALPTAISGEIIFQPLSPAQKQGGARVQLPSGHRLLAENETLLVSTPLENAVQFSPIALEPSVASGSGRQTNGTKMAFSARVTNGSLALRGQKPVLTLTVKRGTVPRDGWAKMIRLEKASIRGYLTSAPGAELELLSQASDTPVRVPVNCVMMIRKCPAGSSNRTSPEYPCGACVDDKTGQLVTPVVPSPVMVPKNSPAPRRSRILPFWGNR